MTSDSSMLPQSQPATTQSDSPIWDSIRLLEQEIGSKEKELQDVELKIRSLESQIQNRYFSEILRIRELAKLYRKQKSEKKEKRLEQKKRGKNYREPKGVKTSSAEDIRKPNCSDMQELKRLYREAIVQIHPDKFVNETLEKSKRSQDLTIQLIDIYQSGDLEELKHIYRHIMSGNAMSQTPSQETRMPDPEAMLSYLIKKRNDLSDALTKSKGSRIYEVLTTYDNPLRFVDELSEELLIRIRQLERRTRTRETGK